MIAHIPQIDHMMEKRLNNCFLLHVLIDITDAIDLVEIAKDFIACGDEHRAYFGTFNL